MPDGFHPDSADNERDFGSEMNNPEFTALVEYLMARKPKDLEQAASIRIWNQITANVDELRAVETLRQYSERQPAPPSPQTVDRIWRQVSSEIDQAGSRSVFRFPVAALRVGAAMAAILLVVVLSMTSTVAADALPGMPLYPVKRLVEEASVALSPPQVRNEVRLDLIERRQNEVAQLVAANAPPEVVARTVETMLDQIEQVVITDPSPDDQIRARQLSRVENTKAELAQTIEQWPDTYQEPTKETIDRWEIEQSTELAQTPPVPTPTFTLLPTEASPVSMQPPVSTPTATRFVPTPTNGANMTTNGPQSTQSTPRATPTWTSTAAPTAGIFVLTPIYPTFTPTHSPTPTPTKVNTTVALSTVTFTPTRTPTVSPTGTPISTATSTSRPTSTLTSVPTATRTASPTHTSSPTAAPTPQKLFISEFLAVPISALPPHGQWIELYNPGQEAINLRGWSLAGEGDNVHLIRENLWVQPRSYLVLARNGNLLANGGVTAAYIYDTLTMNSNQGEISLNNPDGVRVSRVAWGEGTAHVLRPGASLQRVYFEPGSNWVVSTQPWPGSAGDFGTPGGPYVVPGASTATPTPRPTSTTTATVIPATPTWTPTPTETWTPLPTWTWTPTPLPPTSTPTWTPDPTSTPMPTWTPTWTPTPTIFSPLPTPTWTPISPLPTPTETSASPMPTEREVDGATSIPTETIIPTATPAPTWTPSPGSTPLWTPSPTWTPTWTPVSPLPTPAELNLISPLPTPISSD